MIPRKPRDIGMSFKPEMIRAMLDGRKVMTRRIILPQPLPVTRETLENRHAYPLAGPVMVGDTIWPLESWCHIVSNKPGPHPEWLATHLRFAAGDRIWVKETWNKAFAESSTSNGVIYFADYGHRLDLVKEFEPAGGWRSTRGMKKAISRLTLLVTAVKVERLNEITDEDALAEGVRWSDRWQGYVVPGVEHPNRDFPVLSRPTAREMYAALWDTIHGSGEWLANPYVAAISYDIAKANILSLPRAA